MTDQTQQPATGNPPAASGLVIPPDVLEKFGPLVLLVQGSESMNNEERQYWINILPIMTPEQLKNLADILSSEKKQLAAIDEKYSKDSSKSTESVAIQSMEEKIRRQKEKRQQTEQEDVDNEQSKEADILSQIQSL